MKTMEIEISFEILSNIAYARLSELMDDDLSNNVCEVSSLTEAVHLLQIKKAISCKADFLTIRIRYPDKETP